ncbi:MAG: hypothetical protein IT337_03720 [Thermomicrobiales bacterium]|nr:hypothetical protein [Thermomicrobiales bacterium]
MSASPSLPAADDARLRRRLDPALLAVVAVALALAVAAIVIAARSGSEAPAVFPPDSPEAVAQEYFAALDAGDVASAYALLAAPYRREVSQVEFGDRHSFGPYLAARRVSLRDSRVEGDRAFLDLDVQTSWGDPPGDPVTTRVRMVLTREGAAWRLERPPDI